MKKTIPYLIVAIALITVSCERNPYADFSASHTTAYVGEAVYFTNYSSDADYFEWDFGDGTYSNNYDVAHAYTTEGVYTVSLTAFAGDNLVDMAIMDIQVVYPTTLEVEVLEYYDEYPVRGAEVILYPTLSDWEDMTREIANGITNNDGMVVFTDLQAKSYFIDAWESEHNNYILAEEDINFIRTLPLEPNTVNHFYAYVDYVPAAASLKVEAKKGAKTHLKIMKLERKYSDKVPAEK